MALKIRCSECKKKISVDEAFAGGVCRCPYCKALVLVKGVIAETTGPRPDSPVVRPDEPTGRPDVPPGMETQAPPGRGEPAPAAREHVPMARPVKIQGVVSLILLAMMIATIVVVVVLVIKYSGGNKSPAVAPNTHDGKRTGAASSPVNPLAKIRQGSSAIAGMSIKPPVVFVVDGASGMRDTFDYAGLMIRQSVRSMASDGKFTVLIATETGPKFLGSDYVTSGAGKDSVRRFMSGVTPAGATELQQALEAALARKPATIVLLARKQLDDAAIASIAGQANRQKCVIGCITLNGTLDAEESMRRLARQTGGKALAFKQGELDEFGEKTGD